MKLQNGIINLALLAFTALVLLCSKCTVVAQHATAGLKVREGIMETKRGEEGDSFGSLVRRREERIPGLRTSRAMKGSKKKSKGSKLKDDEEDVCLVVDSEEVEPVDIALELLRDLLPEGEDLVKAEKMIRDYYESTDEILWTDYAETLIEETENGTDDDYDVVILSACEDALMELAIASIALLLKLMKVPSRVTREVARKLIVRIGMKRLRKRLRQIARSYFTNNNPLRVATGIVELIFLIGEFLSPRNIFDEVMRSLTWREGLSFGVIGLAYIVATYVSGGAAIAVKLALMTSDIVKLVAASNDVSNNCSD